MEDGPAMISNVTSVIDPLTMLARVIDPVAVLITLFLMQVLKAFLPSEGAVRTTEVIPGAWTTRLLPFVPIVIALIAVWGQSFGVAFCARAVDWRKVIVGGIPKGLVSGIAAAYLYRTTKVTLFGK